MVSRRQKTWAGQERTCEAIPGLAVRTAGFATFQKSDSGPVSEEKKLAFEHVLSACLPDWMLGTLGKVPD